MWLFYFAVVAGCSIALARAGCDSPANKVKCEGCDFETQENYNTIATVASGADGCYANIGPDFSDDDRDKQVPPTGWEFGARAGKNVKLIKQGCRPWGNTNSRDGDVFVGFQGKGISIYRTFTNLEKNGLYIVKFLVAERPNNPLTTQGSTYNRMSVKVNEEYVVQELSIHHSWTEYVYHFYADANGKAKMEFVNGDVGADGSHVGQTFGDVTILLDKVEVYKSLDCGEGATCHEPLPPRTGYTCRCDVDNYKGHDVSSTKASCKTKSNGEALNEELVEVKETIAAIEDGALTLNSKLEGLGTSGDQNAAAVELLRGDMDDLIGKVTELTGTVSALLAANANLKGVLAKSFAVGSAPQDSTGGGSYAPAVASTDGGSINLDVQDGRHATVNGEPLLSAEEIRTLIQSSVAQVLADMSDAL